MSRVLIIIFVLAFSIFGNAVADDDKPVVITKKTAIAKNKQKKKAKKKWDWRKGLPQIGYVYPAGAQQGTTVEVIVCGQRLRNVNNVSISGEGVEVVSLNYIKNVSRRFYRQVRYDFACMLSKKYNLKAPKKPKPRPKAKAESEMGMQAKKKQAKEELEKMPDHVLLKDFDKLTRRYLEIAARNFYTYPNRLQSAPALREDVIITLKIDKDAVPGMRELRLWNDRRGLSNPLRFYVSKLPEVTEKRLFGPTKKMKTKVKLPAIINGQVMPGEIDSFLFNAKKGQKLVFSMMARRIIPYLGDAVPGWFQPVISIHNKKGREMKFADDFRCSPDPVMFFEVPADGEYELRVRDSIYRGRKDFVYRIKAGEFPFVTSIFPLGAEKAKTTKVHLSGYNLTNKELDVAVPKDQIDFYRIKGVGDSTFNPVCLAVDSFSEVFEKEGNNTKDKAQYVKLGSIINGRINRSGDVDVFKIFGRGGEKIVFEIDARNLGSPLDAVISLCDGKGKQMFTVDDMKRINIGFNTHQADPYHMFTIPEDGYYYLFLRDIQNHGGNDFSYRLRISSPRPDFKIYAGVASLNIRRWQTVKEPVRIVRKDGFDGPIVIKDNSEKPVFKIIAGNIKKNEGSITFRLLDRRKGKSKPPFPVQFVGQAEVNGKTVTRKLVPCENMMQAFIYYHWVPYTNLMTYPNLR